MKTKTKRQHHCIFCNKTFGKFLNLNDHTRIHTHEKPFECKICSYSANQPSNLPGHMRTHTGKRPYKCHLCQKAFSQPGNLRRHLMTHTGEKPFKCELCDKCFAQFSNLQNHIRTLTLEKLYKCEICNERYTAYTNLKIHQARMHNIDRLNFIIKCIFCMKHTFSKHDSFGHVRSHISERPYICRFCCREFVSNSSRKRHELKSCKKIHCIRVSKLQGI